MIDDDETDWKVLTIAMDDDKAPMLRLHFRMVCGDMLPFHSAAVRHAGCQRMRQMRIVHDLSDVEAHWPGAVPSLTEWLRMFLDCRQLIVGLRQNAVSVRTSSC